MEASITLKKVGKLIGNKTILAGLSFGIERGSLVAIVGLNDSGKSVLLKLLSGYENPNYGQVFIQGLDMNKRRKETRDLLGYVSFENDLDPWLTIEQNIKFNAMLYSVKSTDYQQRLFNVHHTKSYQFHSLQLLEHLASLHFPFYQLLA